MFKSLVVAATIATTAAPAFAAGDAPAPAPVVIVEDTSSSGAGIIVPLLFLVFVANGLS